MSLRYLVHIKKEPRRLYICERHLHHGLDGFVLFFVALVLMWTDRRDFPWAFAKDFEPEG